MDVQRDVARVAAMLAEGEPRWRILAAFKSERARSRVDDYIAQARRQWVADHADELPTAREAYLANLRAKATLCKKLGQLSVMAKYDDMIGKLLGVLEGDKHLHLHAQGAPAAQEPAQAAIAAKVVSTLPDHVLEALDEAAEASGVKSETLALPARVDGVD